MQSSSLLSSAENYINTGKPPSDARSRPARWGKYFTGQTYSFTDKQGESNIVLSCSCHTHRNKKNPNKNIFGLH